MSDTQVLTRTQTIAVTAPGFAKNVAIGEGTGAEDATVDSGTTVAGLAEALGIRDTQTMKVINGAGLAVAPDHVVTPDDVAIVFAQNLAGA